MELKGYKVRRRTYTDRAIILDGIERQIPYFTTIVNPQG